MRCEHLHDSAVYVLGALSPPEREAYERHLADCAQCRAEVAEFSDLPGLLGRLDPDIAAQIAMMDDDDASAWAGPTAVPPPSPVNGHDPLAPRLLSRDSAAASPVKGSPVGEPGPGNRVDRALDKARTARRTERRRRRWATAATAVLAAFLSVLAFAGIRAAGVGQPSYDSMREVAATVPVTASLALSADAEGTVVKMRCAYKEGVGPGGSAKWTYKLVVVPKSGEPDEIDTWTAGEGDELELTAHSHIPRGDIARIEIRKGDGTTLLVSA